MSKYCDNYWIHIAARGSGSMKFQMSTASSTTASGRDHDVPSAEVVFKTKLCLVSLTRRDGTLMDASSVSEEDIIEICITKGHTHPLGVLCYSAMEWVVLFCSTDKLQQVTCGIVKQWNCRVKPSLLRLWLLQRPILKHTLWHFIQIPQMGRESYIHLPNKLPQAGGCCIISKQNLETLPTMSCVSSWRTLHKKLHNTKEMCPPAVPLQIHGYAYQGVGIPRRMTGRWPFQEG